MSLQRLFWLLVVAVVIFAINIVAQAIMPTKAKDPYGQKVVYSGLVYFIFAGVLGAAILIGLALSH